MTGVGGAGGGGDRPLVVLHVLEALEGGTARHVADLVRFVPGVAHHVVVPPRRVGGATDPLAVPAIEAAGGTVHRVDMRRNPASPANARAVPAIRRLARRLGPDVVHGHSAVGGALARLATADLATRRVYTPNGVHPSILATTAERGLARLTDRVVAVSESEAVVLAARGLAGPGGIAVIRNGVDLEESPPAPLHLRRALELDPAVPLVGFVGRLVPQKGADLFVRAAELVHRRLPAARFVLVGSGRDEDRVAELVATRGLVGVVRHLPFVAGAAALLGQLDLLVQPSRYEGCPYVPLEAMRAGTPVVLSDAVGNRDVGRDGVTARVVRVGDVAALADAVVAVLEDPGEGRRLAEAARHHLGERFDVRANSARVGLLYRELVT